MSLPVSSRTWSLSGPPSDPSAAILRDVWIDQRGSQESLLPTVSDPDPRSRLEHTALIPVYDHELRHQVQTVLSLRLGRPLADLGDLRGD